MTDKPMLLELIARSIRQLGAGDYRSEQIEAALKGAFGVDTQLIEDGTYFVAEADSRIVGCGGWSWRRTLFGGDANRGRDAARLDPAVDAAKIRAFFVDPDYSRRGIGSAILARCEQAASERGFHQCEMMATLPGVRLYRTFGYQGETMIHHPLADGITIQFVPMRKTL
ncbi:MAG: Acetyltransferase, family [Hydrocarboniphaga sp.]|nr:Acetyltransferase, family [Hydrocarboniphaga sp.]